MRGTWQGSGTWQTGGPDFSGLGPAAIAAVIAVVVIVVAEWVLSHVWELIGATVLLALAVAGAVIALSRWTGRREARFAERRRTELAAQAAAELPRPQQPAPAIEQHVHYHLHIGEREAAPVIRTMLPGQAGEAITERKHQP